MDLFFSANFKIPMIPLAVLGLNLDAMSPLSRALVFSDTTDFSFDKVMVLGVW